MASKCSAELQSLIRGLLQVETESRLSLRQIYQHAWVALAWRLGGSEEFASTETAACVGTGTVAANASEDTPLTVQWPPFAGGGSYCRDGSGMMMQGPGARDEVDIMQTLDSVDSMGDTMADDALVYLDSMDYVENVR